MAVLARIFAALMVAFPALVNARVETSIPTIFVVIAARDIDPACALEEPPGYL